MARFISLYKNIIKFAYEAQHNEFISVYENVINCLYKVQHS